MPSPVFKVANKRSAKPSSARPQTTAKTSAKMPATSVGVPLAKAAKKPPLKKVVVVKNSVKKPKLVRDSFKMPKTEYAAIEELKIRAAKLGHVAKKSELLRAGIKALCGFSDAALVALLAQIPTLKTGRPKTN